MKYAWIDQHRDRYSVSRLCRVLGVSRSGYCQWRGRGPSRRAQANAALDAEVAAIYRASRGSYGRPRIVRQLRAQAGRRALNACVAACNARGCARSTSVLIG